MCRTEPAGPGTGLGLSIKLWYSESTRGELRVETKERDGSNLIVEYYC
jgi:hypothetical protein